MDPGIYRIVFWAFGHPAQQVNLAATVAVWYALASLTVGAKPVNEKLSRVAFLLYILFINLGSMHHLLVDPALGTMNRIVNTSYFMYLAVVGSLIHAYSIPAAVEVAQRKKGITGLFGWLARAPWGEPGFAALAVGMSVVLLQDRGLPDEKAGKRIDVWWRGHKNGGLMMLLAHLLTENWEWAGCEVRVLRVIDKEAGRTPAMEALQQVLDFARLDATVQVIVSDRKFHDLLHSHSGDADCVILGFENPDTDHEVAWHDAYNAMLAEMPTSILVCSRSGEDLLA